MRAIVILCVVAAAITGRADDFKVEEGFTPLFNGKDLTGWKTEKGESLDGKTEAFNGRFKVADGVLTLDPAVKGDVKIFTAKEFAGNVHIKFEFKPGPKCNNDLFLHGLKFDIKSPDVKNLKEGEWHTFEIVLVGDKAEYKCNGELLKTMAAKGKATGLGIRAEFGAIEFRRLRVKEG
ncbi:MAG TPA: DUF1080 domain-containing protein [Gemmataceae bacterium]|nr:DUF1080 domain-containing protein [Gemmataceae bacterium]